ncbi:hypothetical protein JW998_15790 [candidate division KSB1 bacterium]|nr:hypothetical protein [candidate division KSB1 bacterium]
MNRLLVTVILRHARRIATVGIGFPGATVAIQHMQGPLAMHPAAAMIVKSKKTICGIVTFAVEAAMSSSDPATFFQISHVVLMMELTIVFTAGNVIIRRSTTVLDQGVTPIQYTVMIWENGLIQMILQLAHVQAEAMSGSLQARQGLESMMV